MFNRRNCDQKSQLSGILTETLNSCDPSKEWVTEPDMEEMKMQAEILRKELQTVKNQTHTLTVTECQIIMQKMEQMELELQIVGKISRVKTMFEKIR